MTSEVRVDSYFKKIDKKTLISDKRNIKTTLSSEEFVTSEEEIDSINNTLNNKQQTVKYSGFFNILKNKLNRTPSQQVEKKNNDNNNDIHNLLDNEFDDSVKIVDNCKENIGKELPVKTANIFNFAVKGVKVKSDSSKIKTCKVRDANRKTRTLAKNDIIDDTIILKKAKERKSRSKNNYTQSTDDHGDSMNHREIDSPNATVSIDDKHTPNSDDSDTVNSLSSHAPDVPKSVCSIDSLFKKTPLAKKKPIPSCSLTMALSEDRRCVPKRLRSTSRNNRRTQETVDDHSSTSENGDTCKAIDPDLNEMNDRASSDDVISRSFRKATKDGVEDEIEQDDDTDIEYVGTEASGRQQDSRICSNRTHIDKGSNIKRDKLNSRVNGGNAIQTSVKSNSTEVSGDEQFTKCQSPNHVQKEKVMKPVLGEIDCLVDDVHGKEFTYAHEEEEVDDGGDKVDSLAATATNDNRATRNKRRASVSKSGEDTRPKCKKIKENAEKTNKNRDAHDQDQHANIGEAKLADPGGSPRGSQAKPETSFGIFAQTDRGAKSKQKKDADTCKPNSNNSKRSRSRKTARNTDNESREEGVKSTRHNNGKKKSTSNNNDEVEEQHTGNTTRGHSRSPKRRSCRSKTNLNHSIYVVLVQFILIVILYGNILYITLMVIK